MKKSTVLLSLTVALSGLYQAKPQGMVIQPGTCVKIESGTTLDLTAGDLTLQSASTGDASLIDLGSVTYSGGGQARVQRYLTQGKWHLISSPVASAVSGMFVNDYLQYFTESVNSWTDIPPVITPLNVMQGYAVWTTNGAPATEVFSGTTNTGTKSRNFTQNSQGWNLLGNPYPSAIDWDAVTIPAALNGAFWLFDPATGVNGEYKYYIKDGGAANTTTQYIPSGQGFFVRATGGSGTLNLTNASRVHSNQSFYKAGENPSALIIKATGNNITTQTAIRFIPEATAAFDQLFDVSKLTAYSPDVPVVYTRVQGEMTAINSLPSVQGNETVPVYFTAGLDGTYFLTAEGCLDIDPSVPVFLEDVSMHTFQDLRVNPEYQFMYAAGQEKEFRIHFKEATGIDTPNVPAVDCFLNNRVLHVNFPPDNTEMGFSGASLSVYNVTGQLIHRQQVTDYVNRIPFDAVESIYLVSITTHRSRISVKVFNH